MRKVFSKYFYLFLPPIIYKSFQSRRRFKNHSSSGIWTGNYSDFKKLKSISPGFNDDAILARAFDTALNLANGELPSGKDSALSDEFQYSWPVLTCLLYIGYINKSQLHVVDFGGAFGINYFQYSKFLKDSLSLCWHIVEQEKFVEKGRLHFETDEFRFSKEDAEISDLQNVNCLIFSGVLQYLEDPYNLLDVWITKKLPFILIDKTTFIKGPVQRLTIQTIPDDNSKTSFPCWLFNTSEFLSKFAVQYELIADFPGHGEQGSFLEDGTALEWKGFLFQKRK